MIDEELEKEIIQLLQLFEQREQLFTVGTGKIIEKLGPTVLAALYEFFNVSYDAISWLLIDVNDGTLMIGAVVSYKNTDLVPEAINRLSPMTGEVPEEGNLTEVQRLMRIGIPLAMVFQPKEEIVRFLNSRVAQQATPEAPTPTVFVNKATGEVLEAKQKPEESDFDNSKLSREQLASLLQSQHLIKGTKH